MKGFILYNGPMIPDIKGLLEGAKEAGIEVEIVNPRKVTVLVDSNSKKLLVEGKEVELPDFAITAFINDPSYGNAAVAQQLEEMGVFCVNKVSVAKTTNDKLKTMQLLASQGIPVPKTLLVRFPFDYGLVEKEFGYPLILKPVSGSKGNGVVLVRNKKELENILSIARAGNISGELIIQEYIETSKGRNLRVVVYGKEAKVCVVRENPDKDEFRSNAAVGGKESLYPMDDKLKSMSDKIAQVLDLFVAGIDLLFSKDGYVVCEVNSLPGLYGEPYDKLNIQKKLFEVIKDELHR